MSNSNSIPARDEAWLRAKSLCILDGVLGHRRGDVLVFPANTRAGYPSASTFRTESDAKLETLARSLLAAAPHLAHDGVASFFKTYLLRVIDPKDALYYRPALGVASQGLVEASLICLTLSLTRSTFWNSKVFSLSERAMVIAWLSKYASATTLDNNWRWFTVVVCSFLLSEPGVGEAKASQYLSASAAQLSAINKMHCGQGWYYDGDKLDLYSAWSMAFWPCLDDASVVRLGEHYAKPMQLRSHEFIRSYLTMFAPDGRSLPWGRSLCYKFAAAAPFAAYSFQSGAEEGLLALGRETLLANIDRFMSSEHFFADGLPCLGFCREGDTTIDPYTCVASPLWCCLSFLPLLLPPALKTRFWSARSDESVVLADPPYPLRLSRTDTDVTLLTGQTVVFPNQSEPDPRYGSGVSTTSWSC